jgi:hypothetical protein
MFILLNNHWKLHLCLRGKLSPEGLGQNADVLWFACKSIVQPGHNSQR